MTFHLAGHLWSAATLVLAVAVGLGAEAVAAGPAGPKSTSTAETPGEIGEYLGAWLRQRDASRFEARLASDPLAADMTNDGEKLVARGGGAPTVNPSGRRSHQLTAILIVEDRAVAVVDDAVVGVGDRLPDGTLVDAIRPDRVWVIGKDGQRRMLTLTARH
jgi:hypothetical protein